MRIEVTSSGRLGSLAKPGMNRGTIIGARKKINADTITAAPKKTVKIPSENALPRFSPVSKRSIKYGNKMEADTREPTDAKMRSGMRKAA